MLTSTLERGWNIYKLLYPKPTIIALSQKILDNL